MMNPVKPEEGDDTSIPGSQPTSVISNVAVDKNAPASLKNARFKLIPRTDEEIHAVSRRIPQESRPTEPVALAKLRARATIGIDPPFTFLDLDNTDLTL